MCRALHVSQRRTPMVVWLALATAALGCTDGMPSLCDRGPGVVEVGRGGSRLRDLPPDGGELPIVLGSQGGIHVLVGFRARDMELEMDVVYRLVDPDTEETVGEPTERRLRAVLFQSDSLGAI